MKVGKLVEILQLHDQEAEVIIAESQFDWKNVLVVIKDPSNPDDSTEIQFS